MTTEKKARNGIVERCKNAAGRTYFRGRVYLADGTLSPRIEIPEPKRYSPTGAKDFVAYAQEAEDETHAIYEEKLAKHEPKHEAPAGESSDAWFARYNAYQKSLGQSDAGKKAQRWRKWISPVIGAKPIASVTKNDVEDIRDALDRAIAKWIASGGRNAGHETEAISGKTAMNVWSALTSSMKEARTSKRRDLRIAEGIPSPCADVLPPGDKSSRKARRKTFLYPREAAQLLACEAIDLAWRETYALALYLYLRPGELRVLTVGDVDLDAMHVSITKAYDYDDDAEDDRVKRPKTDNGIRKVPIEPALAPLLERLCEGRPRTALLAPALASFGEDHLAEPFREHLGTAHVDRVELHASTLTHVQGNFRSCRDSGITWLAMGGLGVDKIMRRAGHDDVQTTMGYVKLAEDISGTLGIPFGPLPQALVDGFRSTEGSTEASTPTIDGVYGCRRRESKPPSHAAPGESTGARVEPETERARATTRSDVAGDPPSTTVDPELAALQRELQRARSEDRFVDADRIATRIEGILARASGNLIEVDFAKKKITK